VRRRALKNILLLSGAACSLKNVKKHWSRGRTKSTQIQFVFNVNMIEQLYCTIIKIM